MTINEAAVLRTTPGWDAAFCPNPIPDDPEFGPWNEVYIGGSSATRRNGWNATEMSLVRGRKCLPVYVPTPGVDNPRQAALDAIAQLHRYHVPANANPWRALMWDMETGILPDPAWFSIVHSVMEAHGYGTISYGSKAWVFGEPNYMGMIVASPDGNPDFTALQQQHPQALIVGKQYLFNANDCSGPVDLNNVLTSLLAHMGPMSL